MLVGFIGLYAWIAAIRTALDNRIGKAEQAQAVIEERIRHLPTSQDMSALTVATIRLTSEVAALNDSLRATNHRIDLHEERELSREEADS